jgi:hypothetical protein
MGAPPHKYILLFYSPPSVYFFCTIKQPVEILIPKVKKPNIDGMCCRLGGIIGVWADASINNGWQILKERILKLSTRP